MMRSYAALPRALRAGHARPAWKSALRHLGPGRTTTRGPASNVVDAVLAAGLTSRVMSLGFGRGLFAIACVVAVTGRAVAQTPPSAPAPPTAAPSQQPPVTTPAPAQQPPVAPPQQTPTQQPPVAPTQQPRVTTPAPAQQVPTQPRVTTPVPAQQPPAAPGQQVPTQPRVTTPAPAQQTPVAPAQQVPAQPRVTTPAPTQQPPTSPTPAQAAPVAPFASPTSTPQTPSPAPTPATPAGTGLDTAGATVTDGTLALPKVEPTLEARERARTAYARGQQAFAAEDFTTALQAFEEAYASVANPIVLVSIGESAAKLGRVETALAAYDAYLRARPDAPDRDEVAQKRTAFAASQAPARLSLTSEPAGADVILDGQLVGQKTPVVLEVRPGAHRVSIVLVGFETERVTAELSPGGSDQRAVTLKASPTPPPVAQAPLTPAQPEPPPMLTPQPPNAAIIVTASLGAAGLIAGSVLGIFALKERSDFNTNPTEAGADRGERLALFSDVGFGIGAMSLITTAVLLFTHDPPRTAEDRASARFELIPSFTPQSASASAKVRF